MYTNAIMTQREADLIAERDAAMEIARQLQMEQDLHAIALTKERDQLRQAAQEAARCLWFTLGTLEDSNETTGRRYLFIVEALAALEKVGVRP